MNHDVILASAAFTLAVIGPLSAWLHNEIAKHIHNDKVDHALSRIGSVAATMAKSIAMKLENGEDVTQAMIESAAAELMQYVPGAVKTLLADGMENADVKAYITHVLLSRLPLDNDLTAKLNEVLDSLLRSMHKAPDPVMKAS
jgi:hypothetical protein